MDYYQALKFLHDELRKIDQAIATLEDLTRADAPSPHSRRGRKSMSEEERKIVSERMKKYWESRRRRVAAGATTS